MKTLCRLFCLLPLIIFTAAADTAFVKDFDKVRSFQKTPLWCWAACIQMVYDAAGVSLEQESIVSAIKGAVVVQGGSNAEIAAGLNAIGFTSDGTSYRSSCIYHPGAPFIPGLLKELREDRPVIVSYKTGDFSSHVVMIHRANYSDTTLGPLINSVTIYDPYTDRDYEIPGIFVAAQTTGTWYAKVDSKGGGVKPTKSLIACSDCDGKGYETETDICPEANCVAGTIDCASCRGLGEIFYSNGTSRSCRRCDGSGDVKCRKCRGTGEIVVRNRCEECNGTGKVDKD